MCKYHGLPCGLTAHPQAGTCTDAKAAMEEGVAGMRPSKKKGRDAITRAF
jgi:hypothetical protein